MTKNIPMEQLLEDAFNFWDIKKLTSLLADLMELYELYDVDKDNWLKDKVGEDNELNVRVVRTLYLISKLAEKHAGALLTFKTKFPKLCDKMEDFIK